MPIGPGPGLVAREGSQGLFSMAEGHFGDEIPLASAGMHVECVKKVFKFIF